MWKEIGMEEKWGTPRECNGSRERQRKRKSARQRQGQECQRVPWNTVGERKIRRKQAAIVSDDSLVATHVTPSRVSVNHPLSMFLSFALSALLTVVASRYQSAWPHDWLTTPLPTSLPHCDNLIARSDYEAYPPALFSASTFSSSSSSFSTSFVFHYPRSVQSYVTIQRNCCTYIIQLLRHHQASLAAVSLSIDREIFAFGCYERQKEKEKEEKEEGSERERKKEERGRKGMMA